MKSIVRMFTVFLLTFVFFTSSAGAVTFNDGQYVKLGYATATPPVWNVKTLPGTSHLFFIGEPVSTGGGFGTKNAWSASGVAQYLNGAYLTATFSLGELAAGVLSVYGSSPVCNVSVSDTAGTKTIAPSAAGDSLVWIPDAQEIQAVYNGDAATFFDDAAKYTARTVFSAGGPYWTRSPVAEAPSKAWAINADGSFSEEAVTSPIFVRPVVSADISKMLFKTGIGTLPSPYEVTYRWSIIPTVTVSGDTVTLKFPEPISAFRFMWPETTAFTVLDDGGTTYAVESVTAGNDRIALKISPAVTAGKNVTIRYSQRFDDELSGLNNTRGAILRASDTRFAYSCATLSAVAGGGDPNALAITTAAAQSGIPGTPLSLDLTATGGTTPYTWSAVSGTLPPDLILSGGKISGTPTMSGVWRVTIQVKDATEKTATKEISFVIGNAGVLSILTDSLPKAGIGQFYTVTLTGSGGTEPYTWSVSNLPDWMTLDASAGTLTGTPLYPGIHDLTISLTDSADTTVSKVLPLTVAEHDGLLIETRILDAAQYNKDYSIQLEASGGTPLYLFALRSGYSLPNGLSLSATGQISGKPSRKGACDFVLDVMDDNNLKGSAVYTMVVVDDAVLNPGGKDFKAHFDKDRKTIRIDFWLPAAYRETEVLSVEALTSPSGYVESSSSEVERDPETGSWRIRLTLHVSQYLLDSGDMTWNKLIGDLYYDGFVVKFQNCSGETTRFKESVAVEDLKGKGDDDSGGCNAVGAGAGGLLMIAAWTMRRREK